MPKCSARSKHYPEYEAPQQENQGDLAAQVVNCFACPRLVAWREKVAREKRAAYADEEYWGRPLPAFGDPNARVLLVGLAPAAHGGNRTGRKFTGDRAGDWLYRALYNAGFANQPQSVRAGDGLKLTDAFITSAVHCAPPQNKPTNDEYNTCRPWIHREIELLRPTMQVAICLGLVGYQAVWRVLSELGEEMLRPRPKFGHGVEIELPSGLMLLCSFHPSQRNTLTGRLTEPMFDSIFARANELLRPLETKVSKN